MHRMAFVLAVTLCAMTCNLMSQTRPNIVVLMADDLGYGELGCQGNPQIPTPNIDSLAREGVRLTSGYVTASYCSPSRAGFLSGQFQSRFGYDMNPTGRINLAPDAGLPTNVPTFVERLTRAGYMTGLVGKWHLGDASGKRPLDRGFQSFFGFLHEGHYFVPPPYNGVTTFLRRKNLPNPLNGPRHQEGKTIYSNHLRRDEPPYDDHNPIMRGDQEVAEDTYLTDALTREAGSFIDQAAASDKPFFLMVSYNAVHSPLQGADAYMDKLASISDIHRRIFAAMLCNLDDSVGAVLQKINSHNLEDDTLIVFLSDNGGPTKELTSSNLPLRGGKGSLYEGGLRVPFIWKWKGHLPQGQTYDQPIVALDIAATSLSLADVQLKDIDGVNVLPHLKGESVAAPHEVLYWRMNDQTAIRKGDWKLIRPRNKKNFELYRLSDDIGEQNDLATTRQTVLADMTQAWMALNAEMIPPLPKPRPPEIGEPQP